MTLTLLVMRLADMHRVHPNQIVSHCPQCNEEVGIYPSGQAALRAFPDAKIICTVCRPPGGHDILAPGAEREPFESKPKE